MKEKYHLLQNGACSGRFTCANTNKKYCKMIPKDNSNKNFIVCSYYKSKNE